MRSPLETDGWTHGPPLMPALQLGAGRGPVGARSSASWGPTRRPSRETQARTDARHELPKGAPRGPSLIRPSREPFVVRRGYQLIVEACEQDALVEFRDRLLAYEGGSELYGIVCP